VKKDGTIVARQVKVVVDCGRHSGIGAIVAAEAGFATVATYRVPNYWLDSYGVYTNNPITGAFRGLAYRKSPGCGATDGHDSGEGRNRCHCVERKAYTE